MRYRVLIHLLCIAFLAAVFHFIWESLHVGLYTGYSGLSGSLPITVWATIGDVTYVLASVLFLSLVKYEFQWMSAPQWADIAGLAILGAGIALYVEYKALALERWSYLPAMPIIPGLEVGLSPVVQMTLLLPLAVVSAAYMIRLLTTRT